MKQKRPPKHLYIKNILLFCMEATAMMNDFEIPLTQRVQPATDVHICIVDDEKMIRNTLKLILSQTHKNIDEYKSYEALLASGKQYDIGFYDHMNKYGMTGSTFFLLNPSHPGRRVLMSGHIENWKGFRGRYLAKPFTIDDVLDCL